VKQAFQIALTDAAIQTVCSDEHPQNASGPRISIRLPGSNFTEAIELHPAKQPRKIVETSFETVKSASFPK
jgi:hypothetical protein